MKNFKVTSVYTRGRIFGRLPTALSAIAGLVLILAVAARLKESPPQDDQVLSPKGGTNEHAQTVSDGSTQLSQAELRGVGREAKPAVESVSPSVKENGDKGSLIDITPTPALGKLILERQGEVHVFLAAVTAGVTPPDGSSRDRSIVSLARMSVLVIMDATGRSKPLLLPGESPDEYRQRASRGEVRGDYALSESEAHRVISGGFRYEIPIGEFPAYDHIMSNTVFGTTPMELDQGVVDGVISLGEQALRYHVK
jgi:hypothetical protein